MNLLDKGIQPILKAGQNCVVEVQRDLSGGVKLVIRTPDNKNGIPALMDPVTAVACGLAMLEAAGVPINAEMGKRMLAEKMNFGKGIGIG